MATPIEGSVYLDANVLIYAMETDGDNGMLARRWLMQVDRGTISAVTSELTIAEVLPHPLAEGNAVLVDGYKRLLEGKATLSIVPVARDILWAAAQIRADLNCETPDAIHVATALHEGCRGFVTNDTRLRLPERLAHHSLADVMAFY